MLLLVLTSYVAQGNTRPSISQLAADLGCGCRMLFRHLAYLEEHGLIKRNRGYRCTYFTIQYGPTYSA